MKFLDESFLCALITEFRRSMQDLLRDLCDDLERNYPQAIEQLRVPVDLLRLVGDSVSVEAYSHWKFVGWIETLNDLIYLIDLREQARIESRNRDFVEQLYAECQRTWYEHAYAEELFPQGAVCDGQLPGRVTGLCRRLARDIVQQALLWEPALSCEWIRRTGRRSWQMKWNTAPNFDRAEGRDSLHIGLDGAVYHPPQPLCRLLRRTDREPALTVQKTGLAVVSGPNRFPIYSVGTQRYHWRRQEPIVLRRRSGGTITLGSTLVYDRRRQPVRVSSTGPKVAERIRRAFAVLEQAWPAGDRCLSLLTTRVCPLKASGVVSFSYRHQPGLSFINCFDRDDLDLIDDLVHENSHHHLNLLLRKYVLYREDCNREIFYSPWRRTLRPVRGILHATFTFAMGAYLFAHLRLWASGPEGRRQWRRAGLTQSQLDRARFRCLEEIASVRYSLADLREAERRLGWITKTGGTLLRQLTHTLSVVSRNLRPHRRTLAQSRFAKDLERHEMELQTARERYGPQFRPRREQGRSKTGRYG